MHYEKWMKNTRKILDSETKVACLFSNCFYSYLMSLKLQHYVFPSSVAQLDEVTVIHY